MGAHELRTRFGGVSRQRIYHIYNRPSFPKPVADLAQGKIWDADKVEEWIKEHRPDLVQPGPCDA